VAELAEELTLAGHEVTILTGFPSHPLGPLFEGWRAKWIAEEQARPGCTLVRCIHSFAPRLGLIGKLRYYVTFAASSFFAGILQGSFDVLVMQPAPIFGGLTAVLLAKIRRAKILYWVHDIHPESALNAGLLKPGLLPWLMRAIDCWVCRRCDVVATLTDDMQRVLLDRGLPQERIILQRHWVDENRIHPLPRENAWRDRHGIAPDTFVALHAGTLGYISGALVMAEAARMLAKDSRIRFLFVGDGPLKESLQRKAAEYRLANTTFLPFQSEEDLNEMQASGDVGLVTLQPLSGHTSIPSKMHGYTSAGRPVIASVDPAGSIARLIDEGGFGWVVPPGDPEALAGAIRHAAANTDECRRRGEKAREFFVREFGRRAVAAQFCRRLEALSGQRNDLDDRVVTVRP
jgi:colanic acid biosynthesis glycosyl transferase WcaI